MKTSHPIDLSGLPTVAIIILSLMFLGFMLLVVRSQK